MPTPQTVSWDHAVTLIRGGSVKSVSQSHSLFVWMKCQDDRQYQTREPKIDAVWHLINELDPDHKKIRFSTE